MRRSLARVEWWMRTAAVVAALVGPATALAQAVHTEVPVPPFTQVNPCTGETLSCPGGTLEFVDVVKDTPSGGHHAIQHIRFSGGPCEVLETGATCHLVFINNEMGNSRPTGEGASTSTDVDTFRIICPGPDNNSTDRVLFHMTVNANGEVTALVEVDEQVCR